MERNELKYRRYLVGDDNQITDLFNLAFTTVIPQSYEGWTWKYPQKPDFDPQSLHICEDPDKKQIVGFFAAEVGSFYHNGQIIKCGRINDVATHPDYQKRGIARRLMQQAMRYLKEQNVEYIFLSADPHGHPREKLYIPNGFKDAVKIKICLRIINTNKLAFKEARILLPTIPFLYILECINIIRKRIFLLRTKRFTCLLKSQNRVIESTIIHITSKNKEVMKKDKDILAYFAAYDQIIPRYQEFAEKRNLEDWFWRRFEVPFEDFRGSFILLKKNDGEKEIIIGGASISIHPANIRVLKTNVHPRIAVIHEYFIDFAAIENINLSHPIETISRLLAMKITAAAKERDASAVLHQIDPLNKYLCKSLSQNGFLSLKIGTWMINNFKNNPAHNNHKKKENLKPLFISTYDMMGFP